MLRRLAGAIAVIVAFVLAAMVVFPRLRDRQARDMCRALYSMAKTAADSAAMGLKTPFATGADARTATRCSDLVGARKMTTP